MRPEDRAFLDGLRAKQKQKQTMLYGMPMRQVERIPTLLDMLTQRSERNLLALYDRCCHGKKWRPLSYRGDRFLEILTLTNPILADLAWVEPLRGPYTVRTGLPSVGFR